MNCLEKDNIPAGYKDSAVGIIPQEWEVKPFKNLGTFLRTNTLSREHMNNVEGLALNIHYGDVLVRYGEILDCSKTAIPWVNNSCRETRLGDRLQNGDIVISDTAEDYTVGKATEVCNVGNNCVLSGLHTMAFRPPKETFALRYLGYYFNSPAYRAQLYSLIQGIKVCSISKSAISNTYIPVPPMEEQRKIAEILGVWDEAIEKQSRLIERLEVCKRALMQRLLTGRTRLPGFTIPWQKVKLGEICKRVTRRNEENNQNVMTISAQKGFVNQTDFFNKSVASSTLDNYYLVHKDEFCYNKSYSNGYPMGAIKRLKETEKAVVTTLYICFSIADCKRLDINFFEQYCEFGGLNRGLTKVANEGGRAHGLLNVTPSDFFGLQLLLPSLSEQKAIAEVLTAADNEIATHRKKLDALRQQKRGLMQQLLTGKTRVKI